ncbi:MAG TPA: CoA ester lyase [Vicinamibacteria bacterium]|nr:CoA ester lyase [Vicinamibacteria bacterium]
MEPRRRSLLYLPGSSRPMIEKAGQRGADVLVLDLEDGVHPDHKDEARKIVSECYRTTDWGGSEVFVRANGPDTAWGDADIEMLTRLRPEAAVLPKCEKPERIAGLRATLGDVPLLLMVETARGVMAAQELASLPGVIGLVFGAADYRASLGAGRLPEEMELLFARSQILHAARAVGAQAFDTPWFEYKDLDGLEASTRRVREMGFDGKTAIHPAQVPVIHRVFQPTLDEIARARGIVEVMQKASSQGKNVATLGNEMVEALHLRQALRTLARARTEER